MAKTLFEKLWDAHAVCQPEGEPAPVTRMDATLEEERQALPAGKGSRVDGPQRVVADGERLGVGHHPAIGAHQRQIV